MRISGVEVGVNEDAAVIRKIEDRTSREGGVEAIQGTGKDLFGGRMIKVNHVRFVIATNDDDT